jgi:hypothetical protein
VLFYGSPAEGLAYLESAAAGAAYARAIYAAAVERGKAEAEDDSTT